MIKPIISLTLTTVLLLGGCSSYKMEIQQGNYITREELALVQPGMSAEQVQTTLGTPLLVDDFHKDRWDYVFYLKSPEGTVQRSSVTVFFQNGVVRDIRNEVVPVNVKAK
ncbi:MAG: cell envelope protein SmpA [Thiothrix lacustris]|uniref:Outer membrane protein assembly factor BamE n=1 Tax=Thiothrix lacustris TaxID=525917 RepID=A0A1Y1QT14_9GAMM|nr:MAG: cell envelope protein SmpA [Thiothrix lacustris]